MKKFVDSVKVPCYFGAGLRGKEEYIGQRDLVFLLIFSLLALQMLMGYLQVRQYQKAVKKWLGKGILGIGQRRGILRPGELLILVYNPREDKSVSVQSMRGYTVFARFEELKALAGLSLAELRRVGIEKDAKDMKWRRKRRPYDPAELTKKKGALIQAVEAVDRYLEKQAAKKEAAEEAEAEERWERLREEAEAINENTGTGASETGDSELNT